MYELLGVAPDASSDDIRAAHERASARLAAQSGKIDPEEAANKQKALDWALSTLANPTLRARYDARLTAEATPAPAASAIPAPLVVEVVSGSPRKSPLTTVLSVIAGLVAVGLAIQVAFMLLAYRTASNAANGPVHIDDAASAAEEKVILQEYYQEHGVRAGSRIEAELLTKATQLEEQEQREKERLKAEEERKYRRFLEESRRIGDQASADRERVEAMAREEAEQKLRQSGSYQPDIARD